MKHPNPIIWSKLPHDILFEIIRHSDRRTQVSWSCTSHEFCHFASAQIWCRLSIGREHLTAYSESLRQEKFGKRPATFIHFLTNNAYRLTDHWSYRANYMYRFGLSPMKQALPGAHVRQLHIDDREATMGHYGPYSRYALQMLIRCCMERLTSLSYDGPLHSSVFASILQIGSLRSLKLRVGGEMMKSGSVHELSVVTDLDLSLLSSLPNLRLLQIGHLHPDEAEGLAEAVLVLPLEDLELSCHGWGSELGIEYWGDPGADLSTSSLVHFLKALTKHSPLEHENPTGFPSTLEKLILRDRHHRIFTSLHQFLANAILPCSESLRSVEMELLIDRNIQKTHSPIDLPQDRIMMQVQSWQQLSSSEEITIIYQYWNDSRRTIGWTSPLPDEDHGVITNIAKILDLSIEDPGIRGNAYRTTRIAKCDFLPFDLPKDAVVIWQPFSASRERSHAEDEYLATAMWALNLG